MKKIILLLSIAIMFISCGKKADFTKVKVGMTTNQLIELVGEPNTKTETGIAGNWWAYDTHLVVIQSDTVNELDTNENVKKRMQEVSEGLKKLSQ